MCAYRQEISPRYKAYFVFLLDQSFSMEEPLEEPRRRRWMHS